MTHESFNAKGVTKQMNKPGHLMPAFSMQINIYLKFRLLPFKSHVTMNNVHDCSREKLKLQILPSCSNKFKKHVGSADFSDQFRKIIVRYKRIGYNINIMRQSACLVFNPITVNNFASLFNCTPVGRASDSMMAPT